MKVNLHQAALVLSICWFSISATSMAQTVAEPMSPGIIHDAEYYIIEAQNGKEWAVEDGKLDEKLAELREKFDAPPNIIHYM
mgnify:CR=1 FL=1|tara:strand:- start:1052 stop:1297 length:246 start_codon:yes stop_codon:yes gene_type:complete